MRGEIDADETLRIPEQRPGGVSCERDVPGGVGDGHVDADGDPIHDPAGPRVDEVECARRERQGRPLGRRRPGVVRRDQDRRRERGEHGGGQREERDSATSPAAEDASFERGLSGADELAAGRVPLGRRLGERRLEDGVERGGQVCAVVGELRRRIVQVREDHRQLALAVERRGAGEALEEQAAERVDVGPAVDLAALDLLGRDVVDRADEAAIARQAADGGDVARQAEVADEGVLALRSVRDENIAGLDVAVDEPGPVRGVQRVGHLAGDPERAFGVERAVAPQHGAEILAFDVGHGQVERPVVLPSVDHVDNVRLVERSCDLRLAQEAAPKTLVIRHVRRQQLEGDPLPGLRVLGNVDGAHRARPDQRANAKARDDSTAANLRHRSRLSVPRPLAELNPGAEQGSARSPQRGQRTAPLFNVGAGGTVQPQRRAVFSTR